MELFGFRRVLFFGVVFATILHLGAPQCPDGPFPSREGSHVHFLGSGGLKHPPAGETVDERLYSESLSVQTFVYIENPAVDSTLVGNMDMTTSAGWKLGCSESSSGSGMATCCFSAFVGHNWRSDMRISRHNPPMQPQRVCTPTPLMPNMWYHLGVTYSPGESRLVDGMAVLLVDGAVAATQNFIPLGDMGNAFTELSSRINYDYITPDRGQTTPPLAWTTSEVQAGPWYEANSPSVAPADVMVGGGGFVGRLDETRVWNVALSQGQMEDSAYEVGWRGPTFCGRVERVASVARANVEGNLTLYVSNNDTRPVSFGAGAETEYNVLVADDETKPSLVATAGAGVADEYWAGALYIEKDPSVALRSMPANVLREVPTGDAMRVEVLFAQGTPLVLDLLLRDPNFDDVLEVRGEVPNVPENQQPPGQRGQAAFVPDYVTEPAFNCYRLNGLPFRLECSQTVTTGWSAFQGMGNYQGPIDQEASQNYGPGNTALLNPITGDPLQRHRVGSCRGYASPNPAYGPGDTFPAPTNSMSQIAYRVVWHPDLALEWYVPAEGLVVGVGLNAYERYRRAASGAANVTQFNAAARVHVRVSPEWLTEVSFPDSLVGDLSPGTSLVQRDAEGKAFNEQEIHLGVGQQVEVRLRARDRNLGDTLEIRAAEDPGLPPGVSEHSQSRLEWAPTVATAADNRDCFNVSSPLQPPTLWDRTLVFAPSEADLGFSYRSCFVVAQTNGAGDALLLDESAPFNLDPLCVTIHVAAPAAAFNFSAGARFEAIVGCELVVPFALRDASAAPYAVRIQAVEDPRNLCHSAGCQAIPGGLPEGAVVEAVAGAGPGAAEAVLRWTPARGQELHEAYRLCLASVTEALRPQWQAEARYAARTCVEVKVRKCQYCVQPGESLDSVARSLGMDHLQMYMLNPYLGRPDKVHPKTVVTTGSLYEVREGDYLQRLGQRFLVSAAELSAANPDVAMGQGQLYPGQHLCVRTPLCDVDCKFDTDCTKRSA